VSERRTKKIGGVLHNTFENMIAYLVGGISEEIDRVAMVIKEWHVFSTTIYPP
jgi:hypothetical protein